MPVTYVPVTVPDATPYNVAVEDSGLVHYVPDLSQDTTINLPEAAAGLWYEFVYSGVAADTSDWTIDAGSDTNYYIGGLLYVDDAPAADSKSGDGDSNSKVTILTPEPGTRIRVECTDGTHWCLSGVVASASGPTFADQS